MHTLFIISSLIYRIVTRSTYFTYFLLF